MRNPLTVKSVFALVFLFSLGASLLQAQPFTQMSPPFAGAAYGSVRWGDYDNDNDPDVLLVGYRSDLPNRVSKVYRNDGGGTFVELDLPLLVGASDGAAEWIDYDGDQDLDIILCGYNAAAFTKLYRNDGSDSFTEVVGTPFFQLYSCSLAVGDYDGDDDPDFAISGTDGVNPYTKIYRNDGGTFVDSGITTINVSNSASGGLA